MRQIVRRVTASTAVMAIVTFAAATGPASVAQAQSGAAAGQVPIGTSKPVPVGHAVVLPRKAHDIGLQLTSAPLQLDVSVAPRDPQALQSFLADVSNPSSPLYRHFLTSGTFGADFGASASTIAAVSEQLRSIGLHPGAVNPDDMIIPVSTTVGAAERALGVSIHNFQLASGRVAYSNTSPPLLPSPVASSITAVVGLSDVYRPVPQLLRAATTAHQTATLLSASLANTSQGPTACSAATNAGGYTAGQLASVYGFNAGAYSKGLLGQGETIALYELEPYSNSDVANFESCYGINTTVNKISVDGGAGTGPGSGESILDIDNAIELAPKATISVYESPNNGGSGPLDSYAQIANNDTAEVVSTSWGICEPYLGAPSALAEESIFMQMAAQGQSMFAASGDSGSEDCYSGPGTPTALAVDDPGSDPYVTSVGGTTLQLNATGARSAETVWNNGASSGAGAGGGGVSTLWAKPSWQSGPGVISANSSSAACGAPAGTYCREVPDVSAVANPRDGYSVFVAGSWTAEGGTSGAAPLWAALTALSDEACGATTPAHAAGMINPSLYAHPSYLFDVTSGNNDYTGTNSGAYPAGTGYDMATGLGTPGAGLFAPGVLCNTNNASVTSTQIPPAATSGYRLFGSDGGVFAFGDATYQGSVPGDNIHINNIVAAAPTPTGHGYWLFGSDGGVFAFGDATYQGSVPGDNIHINNIVAAAPTL